MVCGILSSVRVACVVSLLACSGTEPSPDPASAYETFTLDVAVFDETRTIKVWRPSAHSGSDVALSVLYMPGGGIAEAFPPIANAIVESVAVGEIDQRMMVGIEHSERGCV